MNIADAYQIVYGRKYFPRRYKKVHRGTDGGVISLEVWDNEEYEMAMDCMSASEFIEKERCRKLDEYLGKWA